MISSTLFSQFPTITYNNELMTNLTVRLKFQDIMSKQMTVFYPYTIAEGERADILAHRFYGDASYSWLIYLANNISDPLLDWPQPHEQFDRLISAKYGSHEDALQKIMFYEVDWQSDDSIIDLAAYYALPSNLRRYWSPVYNVSNQVAHFVRSQVDWTIETNTIVQLTVDAPLSLNVGSYVYQMTSGNTVGQGEVLMQTVSGSMTTVYVRHVTGAFSASKSLYLGNVILGNVSAAAVTYSAFGTRTLDPSNTYTTVVPAMEATEAGYWVPVSAYEYEQRLNESKKHIQIVGAAHIPQIEKSIRELIAL